MPELKIKDVVMLHRWIIKEWEKKSTIVYLLVSLFLCGLWLSVKLDFKDVARRITPLEAALLLFCCSAIYLVWLISRRPEKADTNKIGIAVGIYTETRRERDRLRADFIQAMHDEIQKGNHQSYDVVELSDYHSERLDRLKETAKYHKLTRAHLLIFGRCRTREHEGKSTLVLEMNVSVIHGNIPKEVSARLSQEMVKLFPKKRAFPVTEELTGFEITKEIVGYGARYVLGTASLLSMDAFTAFDFHHGLWQDIKSIIRNNQNVFAGYIHIYDSLPQKIVMEGVIITSFYYTTKPNNFLQQMDKYLTIVQQIDPRNYSAHLLRGIYHFFNHDTNQAKLEIKKARNDRDAASQYSEAFLEAYDGDLEQAHRIYQRAFRGAVQPNIPLTVETFIADVLQREPAKSQLWYCLGMLNYFDKRDLQAARQDFSKFIACNSVEGKFGTSLRYAQQYIDKINEELSKESGDTGLS